MSKSTIKTIAPAAPVEVRPSRVLDRARLGVTLLRRLGSHRLGKRWLARSHDDGAPRLVYELHPSASSTPREDLLSRAIAFDGSHGLVIERLIRHDGEPRWVVCPYPGTHEGVLSLDRLLTQKPGGRLSKFETSRAVRQLLQLQHDARRAGLEHGAIRIDEILVDRHGRLLVELFGFAVALGVRSLRDSETERRDELKAIFRIGRELVTGASGGDVHVEMPRVLWPDAPRPWREWLSRGLGPAGFATPHDALASMPR